MVKKIIHWIRGHKLASFFFLAIVIWGGYRLFGPQDIASTETRYILGNVARDTLIVSVSGSGQVAASDQVDLKPKVSGDVVRIAVSAGQAVKGGTAAVFLDSTTAEKAVRDAEGNLASATLALEKLHKPADALTLLQTQNALAQSKESLQKAQDDVQKAYEDGFNAVANAFLDLPNIITGLHDVLYSLTSGNGNPQWYVNYYMDAVKEYDGRAIGFRDQTVAAYQLARSAYDTSFAQYRALSRFSEVSDIEASVRGTYEATRLIAEAVKSTHNLIQFYKDILTEHTLETDQIADTHLSSLHTFTGDTNSHLSTLLSLQRSLQTNKETITNAERTIAEKTASLEKLRAGSDPLDIRSQELVVTQRSNALADAKETLANYQVRVPFDGTIASVGARRGDSVSSGTVLATVITTQRVAEISLNEVDAAKVAVGQKATVRLDAIDGLSLTGRVAEIDAVGTLSQGVVSYTVKIGFDTDDVRVKPGMSVSADIILDVKPDVLVVPSAAVKIQGNAQYVDILDGHFDDTAAAQGVIANTPPRQQVVTVGGMNDTLTEIISGLAEGDQIVVRTFAPSTTAQTQQAGSLFPGGGRGFGGTTGGVRIQGR